MKIDVKIEWVIDDSAINVHAGKSENVSIDMDYVEANEADIIEWIENELSERYGTTVIASRGNDVYGDFVIKTDMSEIIDDIKFDEFESKTQSF